MRRKPGALTEHESHVIRIAWWVSFLATIAIVAILGMVRSAQAATLPVGDPTGTLAALPFETAAEAEDEDDESGEAEEEREAEECDEDGEECDEEVAAEESDSCILRTASAKVSVLKAHDKVRLALHYTAFSPAVISIEYGLRGSRGALRMDGESRRFSRSGVFRDTETLSEAEMAKVSAAREFDVRLHAVNTPRYCHKLFDRELTARHVSAGRVVWTD
jgi:hypothetical protein